MKTAHFLLPIFLAVPVTLSAQKPDLNALIQQGAMGGVTMVEDNDPFEPNEFIGGFTMVMHSYKNGNEDKDSPMTIRIFSKADMVLMWPEVKEKGMQEMKMLTDLKGKWQYTMMTDDKGKRTAMKMRKMKLVMPEEADANGKEPEVVRTGETRTIDGHNCHQYVFTNEDGTWSGWVAEGMATPFTDMTRSMGGGKGQLKATPGGVNGFPLESEFTSADGKERVVVHTRDLKVGSVDEKIFSLQGYDVMEMPVMNFGGR